MKKNLRPYVVLAFASSLTLVSCSSIGPRTLTRDRFDYSTTVAESWKQQTLLNIVKLRYLDLPVFLEVGQIVSGYTVETSGTLGASTVSGNLDSNSASLGGGVRYTDRPTITYTPLTGDKFLRGLMTPIQPSSVFFLLQSGYAADFVMAVSVESLNGLRNPSSAQFASDDGAQYSRAIGLLREIQLGGALLFRVEVGAHQEETTVVFFRDENAAPEIVAKIAELRSVLQLQGNERSLRLVNSPVPGEAGELGIQTRSMLQILLALASTVEIPAKDLEEKRALPSRLTSADKESAAMPFFVRYSTERPERAYAAVPYRDGWFWIDDADLRSKRAFGFVMFLFTLSDAGSKETLPVLTIPTG